MSTDLLRGAVDLYVHASPDLLPRLDDDLALARQCKMAGLAGAVHRHHFGSTAERAMLASAAQTFPLLGAVIANDAIGGFNPTAVEVALRLGAVWVGFPTLSARHFRQRLGEMPSHIADVLSLGPGQLEALDDSGQLKPEVDEILKLAARHQAVIGLGYGDKAECHAVIKAALGHGVTGIVLTYPHLVGFTSDEVYELTKQAGVFLEICAFGMHPTGASGGAGLTSSLKLARRIGPERCVLSSDGGMTGSPPPPELLEWACGQFLKAGFTEREVLKMVHDNPRHLLAPRLAALGPTL